MNVSEQGRDQFEIDVFTLRARETGYGRSRIFSRRVEVSKVGRDEVLVISILLALGFTPETVWKLICCGKHVRNFVILSGNVRNANRYKILHLHTNNQYSNHLNTEHLNTGFI